MSNDDRPSRRRIAGESAPAAGKPAARGPRVVRKPVRRPGSAPATPADTDAPREDADLQESPEVVDPSGTDESAEESAPAEDPAPESEAADASAEQPAEETDEDGTDERPRVAPAVRRPWRREKSGQQATDGKGRGEKDRDEDAKGAAPGRLRRVLLVLVAVLAVAFAAAAGYWAYGQVRGATGIQSAHADAESAATKAAEQVLSYRYDQLDEHLEKSQELMTPSFGKEFETISPALNDLAPQRQIVVEATAREAAPLPCGDDCSTDEAEVLVFVDQARVADGENQPTVFGNRITLTMVHEGGEWLVDDIEAY